MYEVYIYIYIIYILCIYIYGSGLYPSLASQRLPLKNSFRGDLRPEEAPSGACKHGLIVESYDEEGFRGLRAGLSKRK